MNFFEISFPDTLSAGAIGGPQFATTISTTSNKTEVRSSNWLFGRNLYKINCNILSETQLNDLIALFNICRGRAVGFRFKDYSDFRVKNCNIATSDGVTKEYQLIKRYNFADYSYFKTIYKPVQNSVKIYINNVEQTTDFTVEYETGLIKFNNIIPINSVLTADFEFDMPVRFNSDNIDIVYNGKNKSAINNLELIEIKPL